MVDSPVEILDPIFRRRWPIIITFFIFASNNAFQYVEIWFSIFQIRVNQVSYKSSSIHFIPTTPLLSHIDSRALILYNFVTSIIKILDLWLTGWFKNRKGSEPLSFTWTLGHECVVIWTLRHETILTNKKTLRSATKTETQAIF